MYRSVSTYLVCLGGGGTVGSTPRGCFEPPTPSRSPVARYSVFMPSEARRVWFSDGVGVVGVAPNMLGLALGLIYCILFRGTFWYNRYIQQILVGVNRTLTC